MQTGTQAIAIERPETSEYNDYYENYVSLVADEPDLLSTLRAQVEELRRSFADVPEERGTFSYAEGKWTLKEMLSHLIDGERHFAYRLLRISRGDKTPIEGFEQDGYIEYSHANERTFEDLFGELEDLRRANMRSLNSLHPEDWLRTGTANGSPFSVRALAFIMAGHIRHHLNILRERYMK